MNGVWAQSKTGIVIPASDSLGAWQKELNIPALGIATLESGKLKYLEVLGELQAGVKAPQNALFDVASLSKSIVTMMTLKLVSQGQWALDAPLYPYWVDPDVQADPRHKKLTTRHVLAHQTGFKNWRWMEESQKLTFHAEPGEQVGYSGEGFEYLKKALENKFDKPLTELVDSLIFRPLAMEESYMQWEEGIDPDRIALGHSQEGEAFPYKKIEEATASDDLLITLQDLGLFCEDVLMQRGLSSPVLEDMRSLRKAFKPQVGFSLGWIVFPDLPGGEYALFNAGGDKGVGAVILLLPQSQRGLILTTNGDNGRALIFKLIGKMLNVGPAILSRL